MSRFAWMTPRRWGCPAAWKLTRAATAGEHDPDIDEHLAACAPCAAEHAALGLVASEARNLPSPAAMSAESRASIAGGLLAAPPVRGGSRPWWMTRRRRWTTTWLSLAAAAGAAVVVAAGVVHKRGDAPHIQSSRLAGHPSRASIRAIGSARFARVQPPPDEIVRLDDGRIELDVIPLAAGERFRVVAGNGEVEVRGTSFEVLATERSLLSVSVSRGRVEVRSGGGLAVLDPGDRWERTAPAVAAPAVVEPPAARQAPGAKLRASRPPSAVESALFDRAWSALRGGNLADAASTFAELERRAQGSAIEEDAAYWRAVAIARARDSVTAGSLFRDFLRRFPSSSRKGEATVALGWILLEAGNIEEARRAFERAASDPAPGVRSSAAEGIRQTTSR